MNLVKSAALRRLDAYKRLGVDPNLVAQAAKISHILRKLPGGIAYALDCLRASTDPNARRFLVAYDDITLSGSARKLLPFEAFAVAAGVDVNVLLGTIAATAHRLGAQVGSMMAAIYHPDVVRTSIAAAMEPEGTVDRMAQLKHMGFLPMPKGSQVNVSVQANAQAQSATAVGFTDLPAPESTIRELEDRFNEDRRDVLPAVNIIPALPAAPTLSPYDPMTIPARMPYEVDADKEAVPVLRDES